jgi:hypothetical protein
MKILSTVYVRRNGRLWLVDVGTLITSLLPGSEPGIIACPLQQLLRERLAVLRYMHSACLVWIL